MNDKKEMNAFCALQTIHWMANTATLAKPLFPLAAPKVNVWHIIHESPWLVVGHGCICGPVVEERAGRVRW
jgi:hypothetical protein